MPLGSVADIGQIVLQAPHEEHPHKLQLTATIKTATAEYSNHWDFWMFPKGKLLGPSPATIALNTEWPELHHSYPWVKEDSRGASPQELLVTDKLDRVALEHLRNGGRVLLAMSPQPTAAAVPFFPGSGGAMGTLIPEASALGDFPNDGFADLQFENMLNGASPVPLDGWPAQLTPILGAIRTKSDFLSKNKGLSRAGYIFEVQAGGGELLVTSPGLWNHYDENHPAAIYLFDRLLRYAVGKTFSPKVQVPDELLQKLVDLQP